MSAYACYSSGGSWATDGEDAAFRRQAILLEAAVRLVRDCALDKTCGEGWIEVVGAEGGAMGKLEAGHALYRAEGLVFHHLEQRFDLIGELVADLVGAANISQRG